MSAALDLKPGTRLRSAVCTTEVIVIRAPGLPTELECGGMPMVATGEPLAGGGSLDPKHADGTLLGKRYADEERGIEVLCTKAGEGSLAFAGTMLHPKDAKPLPSSD